MLLVECHTVITVISRIGPFAELCADSHLCRKTNHGNPDPVFDQSLYGFVYISRITREESAIYDENFTGAMRWGIEQEGSAHLESILQAGIPLRILVGECLQLLNMLCWIAAHIANPNGNSITHSYYTELGYGILLEVLGDELGGVLHGEAVSCGP